MSYWWNAKIERRGGKGSGINNFCYKTQLSKDLDDMLIKDVCLKTGATVISDDLVL